MNVYSRTLTLPSAVRPVREHGSSALDRAVTAWAAPDPAARVLDPWGAPAGSAVVRTGVAAWPAPDPAMRFDLPAPELREISPIDDPFTRLALVEPRHTVQVPDLWAASRDAVTTRTDASPHRKAWPAPTATDSAFIVRLKSDRSLITRRLVIALAATVGAFVAGAAAFISLF